MNRLILLGAVCLVFLAACSAKPTVTPLPPNSSVAVAGFIHPQYDWELMAGVLPEQPSRIPAEALASLNIKVSEFLQKTGHSIAPFTAVKGCEEIALASKPRQRMETVEYWKAVGKCMKVSYVLLPFITQWQDRDGGEWGVNRPASVTFDLYLLDVQSGQIRRFHYEEVQRGLAENLLESKRFFRRSGKWVSAEQITLEAFETGVKELGL